MSKLVDGMPDGAGIGGARKKPKPVWLDGKTHVLEPGVDFKKTTKVAHVRGMVHETAKRHGVKARCHITEDGVVYVRAVSE